MQIDASKPHSWIFTPEELALVGSLLNKPVMVAFLQSLEADALIAQHEVELVQDISDAALRVVAASAYAQGQIQLVQQMRNLHKLHTTDESEGE